MPLKQIRLDTELLQLAEQQKPSFLETSQFIGLLVQKALTGVDPLATMGDPPTGGAPSKAVNKKKDVDFSLRAEEAHVESTALEAVQAPSGFKRHQVARSIDPAFQSLQCHADLIQEFWRAKTGKRSDRAWTLLLNGLTAIQAAYGDRVVREQLELAAANGWSSVTLANYEKFGLPKNNVATQAHSNVDWEQVDRMTFGAAV